MEKTRYTLQGNCRVCGENLVMCAACVMSIDGITLRTQARLYGYVITRVEGIVLRSIVEKILLHLTSRVE